MIRVAVVGGSGDVGRTVVDVLRDDSRYEVIVLGRSVSFPFASNWLSISRTRQLTAHETPKVTAPNVQYLAVSYDDHSGLVSLLEDNAIHTVISCLMVYEQSIADAQAAVIAAADKASFTRRFIATNWGPPTLPENEHTGPWFTHQLAAHKQLRATSLEWTEIATGYFMDYWGGPSIKTNLNSAIIAIDIAANVAGIPGTGDEPVAFAYTYDVVLVVAEVLGMPPGSWEDITYIVGDKLTWNEFLALAEEAKETSFAVAYDSEEKLARGEMTKLPNHVEAYARTPKAELVEVYSKLGLMMVRGAFDLDLGLSVSRRYPDIKMLTVREMFQRAWK